MNHRQMSSQPAHDPVAALPFMDRIAICEPRLALSASVAADFLIDTLAGNSLHADPGTAPDPLTAAAAIRSLDSFDGSGQSVVVIDS